MTAEDSFSPEIQRYLDGERVEDLQDEARMQADHFDRAIQEYTSGLDVPDARVDMAVMRAIRARESVGRTQSFWRWLVQPSQVRIRPALLAAASIALLALGAAMVVLLPGGDAPSTRAAAPAVLVRFELRAPDATTVTLAGSFNEWSADRVALQRNPATGVWSGTIPLRPGRHEYSFVIDGETWVPDPSAHAQVDDGFGQVNSVIVVGPRGVVRS